MYHSSSPVSGRMAVVFMTPQWSFSYKLFVTGITGVFTELMVAMFMTTQVSLSLKIFVTSITVVHQSLNCHNCVPG